MSFNPTHRTLSKINSELLGFSRLDARIAMQLIVQNSKDGLGKKIPRSEMYAWVGSALGISPRTVQSYLTAKKHTYQTREFDTFAGQTSMRRFEDTDYLKAAKVLGIVCGKPEGFSSVPEMIAYAQEHYTRTDGKEWEFISAAARAEQKEEKKDAAALAKEALALQRHAATQLMPLTGQTIEELLEFAPKPRQFRLWLLLGNENLGEAYKREGMEALANKIGYYLAVKNGQAENAPVLTPEMMLEEAQKRFPEDPYLSNMRPLPENLAAGSSPEAPYR